MKRIFSFCLCLLLVISLTACGAKEASSDTEAKRILISSISDLSEISKQLDDENLSVEAIEKIEKRIDNSYADIHSTDTYKDIDTVKSDYEQATKLYTKVQKKAEVSKKVAQEKESKLTK